jgi:hypothetical protein
VLENSMPRQVALLVQVRAQVTGTALNMLVTRAE